MPIQWPLAGRKSSGTCASVSASTGANSPALSTSAIAGEFSVRNTSAGEAAPSCDDLVAELGVAALAQRDLDAGLLGEGLGPGLGQALVLGVVDDDAVGSSCASAGPVKSCAKHDRAREK